MTDALCNQQDCPAPAIYRYTWPGKNEAGLVAAGADPA